MSTEEILRSSIDKYVDYPANQQRVGRQNFASALQERFIAESARLFLPISDGQENKSANVGLLEVPTAENGKSQPTLTCLHDLKDRLAPDAEHYQHDPACRMVFLKARNAQSCLTIYHDMFCYLLSYLQVMPAFLDFIFSFGKQIDALDPHLGGFHSRSQLSNRFANDPSNGLGRSGRHLEFCYSLRSPERTGKMNPWSIRQTLVWHSFDLHFERQSWVFVKGTGSIETAMTEHLEALLPQLCTTESARSRSMMLALTAHLEVCSCSNDNWHWYLSTLESEARATSKKAIAANLQDLRPRADLNPEPINLAAKRSSYKTIEKEGHLSAWIAQCLGRDKDSTQDIERANRQTRKPRPPPSSSTNQFELSHLQEAQSQEQAAHTALIVLRSNSNTVKEVRQEYEALRKAPATDSGIDSDVKAQICEFEAQLLRIEASFELLQARAEALLQQIKGGKDLLHSILQAESIKHTYEISVEAYLSAQRMEQMTDSMYGIAADTQDETVRVRVLTVIASLFLPGTFISTLMSTQMIKFPEANESIRGDNTSLRDGIVGLGALQVYLLTSLPLVAIVFIYAWWVGRKPSPKHPG